MSTRKSPSGPLSQLTGLIRLAQTVIAPATAGNAATATAIAEFLVPPQGTALGTINPTKLTTNDIVSISPRGTVPIGTSQIGIAYARVASVATLATSTAIIEVAFINASSAGSATAVANTWSMIIDLNTADL